MSENQTKSEDENIQTTEAKIIDDEDPSVKAEAEKVEAERKAEEAAKADAEEEPKKEDKTETKPKVETPQSHGLNLAKENEHNDEAAASQGDPKTCYNDSKTHTTSRNKE